MDERYREGPGLVESLLRHRWLVVSVTLLGTIAAYFLASLEPERYETEATMVLSNLDDSVLGARLRTDTADAVRTEALRLQSREVRTRAGEFLNPPIGPAAVRQRIAVSNTAEVRRIQVQASGPTPESAATLANAMAIAYQDVRRAALEDDRDIAIGVIDEEIAAINSQIAALSARDDDRADIEIQALVNQRTDLQREATAINAFVAQFGTGVEVFEQAEAPAEPAAPQPLRTALLGMVLSGLLAVALAYWRAGQLDRVLDSDDAAVVLQAPLLGVVPSLSQQGVDALSDGDAAEAFLFVLSSVEFELAKVRGSAVLVTAPISHDHKTEAALHLAVAATKDGRRALLVDGDVRRRRLSEAINAGALNGLTELAAGDRAIEECLYNYWVARDLHLPVVAAGRAKSDTQSFVRTPGFRKAMLQLKEESELIIVDSAPILAVADTSVIAGQVDGLVLVVAKGTPIKQLQDTRERLAFVSAPLLGYVFVQDSVLRERSLSGVFARNNAGGSSAEMITQ